MSTPTREPTVLDRDLARARRADALREVAGLLLLLVAVAGVSVAAFATDTRLGVAVVSLALGGLGWAMTTDRSEG